MAPCNASFGERTRREESERMNAWLADIARDRAAKASEWLEDMLMSAMLARLPVQHCYTFVRRDGQCDAVVTLLGGHVWAAWSPT